LQLPWHYLRARIIEEAFVIFDRWEYTVPANTAEDSAIKVECKISSGLLRGVGVDFPYGCNYLARCRVFLGEKPVLPRSSGSYLAANGRITEARYLNEKVRQDLPVLKWFVWNLDDTFPHTLVLEAEWQSEEEIYEKQTYLSVQDLTLTINRLVGL